VSSALDIVVTPRGRWLGQARFMGRVFPCTLGRGGVRTRKREGDGATPRGVHGLVGMLYRPDRMARPADWALPVRLRDGWCDDPASQDYNHIIRRPFQPGHERLFRADPLYDLVILTDWNWPIAAPGHGSAIFIHRWRGPGRPTAGCVAFAPHDLRWIAARIRHQTRLVVR